MTTPIYITTSGSLISTTFIENIRWPVADALVFAPRQGCCPVGQPNLGLILRSTLT